MVRPDEGSGGGSSTVTIGVDSLRDAIEKLGTLVSNINSERNSAQLNCPISLPSLADGSALARTAAWLEDQKAPLQAVLDLGMLLDDEGSGTVSFTGTGDIDSIKAMLGRELANDLDDVGDIKDVGDRERMTDLAAVLARYATDPKVAGPFAQELGPDGVVSVLQQLRGLTEDTAYLDGVINEGGDGWEETGHLEELQDSLATSLAQAVGAASTAKDSLGQDYLDKDFGEQLVNGDHSDAWSIGTLFQYGAKNDVVFSEDLLVSSGEALLEREEVAGWQHWEVNDVTPTLFGKDHSDDKLVDDPVLQWMSSLANNGEASQTILLDQDRAEYLLDGRDPPYEDGTAAGDVLRAATVDQALSDGPRGENAAKISSHVLDYFGGDATPLEGIKEEIGGIIATYIADVDRVAQNDLDEPAGVAGSDLLPPWLQNQGMPPYGITMSVSDLRGVLHDIGDNDVAGSTIGEATMRLNEARLQEGIRNVHAGADPQSDPIGRAAGANAQLTGFLQDGLLSGGIMSEEADDKERKKVAEFFTLPLNMIDTKGTGPLGPYVIGQVKEQIVTSYVNSGVSDEISKAETQFGEAKNATTLQALRAILESNASHGPDQQLPVGELATTWRHENGSPVPLSSLEDDEIRAILVAAENDMTGGYPGLIKDNVDSDIRDLIQTYGDK